jgi:hypothetical protein
MSAIAGTTDITVPCKARGRVRKDCLFHALQNEKRRGITTRLGMRKMRLGMTVFHDPAFALVEAGRKLKNRLSIGLCEHFRAVTTANFFMAGRRYFFVYPRVSSLLDEAWSNC